MNERVWFYSENGRRFGPFSNQTIQELIKSGEVIDRTLLWRKGADEWVKARSIEEFTVHFAHSKSPPSLPTTGNLESSHKQDKLRQKLETETVSTTSISQKNNYFVRHWKGENSLVWAWWINGTAINAILLFIDAASTESVVFESLLVALLYIFVILGIYIWQIVGIWRSAVSYIFEAKNQLPSTSALWGQLALVFLVLGAMSTAGTYLPLIQDTITLIALEDADYNKQYYIQLKGETDVVLSGFINSNSVAEIKTIFNEQPSRNALVINSPGGLLVSAFELADFIIEKRIIVAAKQECVSACVLLLASSHHSLVTPDTAITFHHPEPVAEFQSPVMLTALVEEEAEYYRRFEEYGIPSENLSEYKKTDFTPLTIGEAYEASIFDYIWDEDTNTFHDPKVICEEVDCFVTPVLWQPNNSDGRQISVFSLETGHCFNDILQNESAVKLSYITLVSCEIPHDNEVLATYELDLLNIPEQNELLEKSNDGCLELFEGYVGVDYASSSIEIYTLRPTEESWEQGDRSVNCIGYDMNLQKLNKSIKASGI